MTFFVPIKTQVKKPTYRVAGDSGEMMGVNALGKCQRPSRSSASGRLSVIELGSVCVEEGVRIGTWGRRLFPQLGHGFGGRFLRGLTLSFLLSDQGCLLLPSLAMARRKSAWGAPARLPAWCPHLAHAGH